MAEEMNGEQTEQQVQGAEEADLTSQTEVTSAGDSEQQTVTPEPEYEIERNGQMVKIPYSQAKDYVSKGYDYTQKTQELAQQRAALQPYQEMAQYLQTNPDKAQAIYKLLAGQEAGQEVDPVQQQIAQQGMVLNQLVQQTASERLNNMLTSIKGDEKYEGLFKDQDMEDILLATALQTRQTSMDGLKATADKIHSKWLKASVKAEKAGEQKVISNLASPTRKGEVGKGTFAPPKGFDPATASAKELHQRALEML